MRRHYAHGAFQSSGSQGHSRVPRGLSHGVAGAGGGMSNEVVARFNNDQMDVAFVRARQIHADGVVVIPLQEEPMVVALPRQHPMARSRGPKTVPLQNLASDPFILIGPPGTGLHDETVAAWRRSRGFLPVRQSGA